MTQPLSIESGHALKDRIVVWACPDCGYWRQERSTGVHQAFVGTGKAQAHRLVAVEYDRAAGSGQERRDA